MSSDKLVKYYLLCTVRQGSKAHVISTVEAKIGTVFTKKEVTLFLRKHDGYYTAREIVIGGGGQPAVRAPIIVYI